MIVSRSRMIVARSFFFVAAALSPASAYAQEVGDERESAIVVEGERDARQRPSDEGSVSTNRPVIDRTLRSTGAMGALEAESGAGMDGSFDAAKGREFGNWRTNWSRAMQWRQLDGNSPVLRYGIAINMANCAVAADLDFGHRLIDTRTDADFAALTDAFNGKQAQCRHAAERASPVKMVNDALAETMVVEKVEQPPLRATAIPSNAAAFIGAGQGKADLSTVGRCVAVFSPGYAYDVLFTTPGSSSEREMLDLLWANTPECGVRERPKKISTVYQRMAIAMGLYRWHRREGGELAAAR